MREGGNKAAIWSALQILGDPNHRHFAAIFKEIFDRMEGPVKQSIEHSVSTQLLEGIALQGQAKGRTPEPLPDGIGGMLGKDTLGDEELKKAPADPTADGGSP
jgi:hypothetical protein